MLSGISSRCSQLARRITSDYDRSRVKSSLDSGLKNSNSTLVDGFVIPTGSHRFSSKVYVVASRQHLEISSPGIDGGFLSLDLWKDGDVRGISYKPSCESGVLSTFDYAV